MSAEGYLSTVTELLKVFGILFLRSFFRSLLVKRTNDDLSLSINLKVVTFNVSYYCCLALGSKRKSKSVCYKGFVLSIVHCALTSLICSTNFHTL